MSDYRILEWDSDFFGFSVALITRPVLTAVELERIIQDLKRREVRLSYWPAADTGKNVDRSAAEALGGRMVNEKITFSIDLADVGKRKIQAAAEVERYLPGMNDSDMEHLALQCGTYSRYAVDPDIPREKLEELFRLWIHRSIRKEIADEVLVIREGTAVAGMITLGEKNRRGEIGLVGVAERHRSKGYGRTLVYAAHEWFVKAGYRVGQVVTQRENTTACRLYRACGYAVERVEHYFHFWL